MCKPPKKLPVLPEVRKLLADAARILGPLGRRYALGGAVAMALRGVVRSTLDIDVFVAEEVRGRALSAFYKAGYRIEPVFEPFHYLARPPWKVSNAETRTDLLFPAGQPEVFGIETSRPVDLGAGLKVRTLTPLALVLGKLYSDDPRHLADLHLMYHRGLVDEAEIEKVLRRLDPPMVRRFRKLLAGLGRKRGGVRRGVRWPRR